MPFTTLAERFEQQSKDIYSRFAPSDGQSVVIKPDTNGVFGSNSRVKSDTRALPVVSTLRDTRRVSKFLTTSEGGLFLGKQTLLQTGNTFENTRLYNPVSPLLNVVPFLHIRRDIVLREIPSGFLQNSTVTNLASRFSSSTQSGISITSFVTQLKNTIAPTFNTDWATQRPESKVFYSGNKSGPTLFTRQPLNERGNRRVEVFSTGISKSISNTRKAITAGAINGLKALLPTSLQNTINTSTTVVNSAGPEIQPPTDFYAAAAAFKSNFFEKNNVAVFNRRKIDANGTTLDTRESGNRLAEETKPDARLNSKYLFENQKSVGTANPAQAEIKSGNTSLKDLYNVLGKTKNTSIDSSNIDYTGIYGSSRTAGENGVQSDKSPDIIKFIFTSPDRANDVQFRALITSIKESIQPEFNEQRYVGRTERFVTYAGAKRSVSLNFNIVAFSPEEQYGMWQRINYLSGLAFPQGVKNGFMVPPLFRVTIGGIYENQPCFLQTLDFDFLDETITFDVDREVPHAVNVSMQINLLEKRSRFYDSPFYKIVEDMAVEQVALRGNNQ
jgi:hypothetical protein